MRVFEEGEAMIREQATLRLPGSTEIPLIAFDDWRFWVLLAVIIGAAFAWKRM